MITLFIAGFFVLSETGRAESFPFRSLEIGNPVPDVTLAGYKNTSGTSLHSQKGKPLLLLFWGGDLAAKKKRTIKVMKVVQGMSAKLKKNGVHLLVVNVQNDTDAVVKEVTKASGLTAPLYMDSNRNVYGKFGLYVLPSMLMVNKQGKVTGGVGYSKDIAQRLQGEVDIMLGTKSRKTLEAELNPKIKEIPEGEKQALRHLKMGINLVHKGMQDSAVREFSKALELNSKLAEAKVELGCIYVEQDKLDDAVTELEAALQQKPKLLKAEICLARVSAKMGEVAEALDDVQALLFRNGRSPELHFLEGELQEQLGHLDKAAKSYKKAFELLQRKDLLHE